VPSDRSESLLRRWTLIEFNRTFRVDPSYEDDVLSCGDAILRWAVAGYRRLRAQGRYTAVPSSDRRKAAWRRDIDPVLLFVDESLIADGNSEFRAHNLYVTYKQWAEARGYRPVCERNFGQSMAGTAIGASEKNKAGTQRVYRARLVGEAAPFEDPVASALVTELALNTNVVQFPTPESAPASVEAAAEVPPPSGYDEMEALVKALGLDSEWTDTPTPPRPEMSEAEVEAYLMGIGQ
jgi:phage/plasmid-associated DNA primase